MHMFMPSLNIGIHTHTSRLNTRNTHHQYNTTLHHGQHIEQTLTELLAQHQQILFRFALEILRIRMRLPLPWIGVLRHLLGFSKEVRVCQGFEVSQAIACLSRTTECVPLACDRDVTIQHLNKEVIQVKPQLQLFLGSTVASRLALTDLNRCLESLCAFLLFYTNVSTAINLNHGWLVKQIGILNDVGKRFLLLFLFCIPLLGEVDDPMLSWDAKDPYTRPVLAQ